MTAYTTPPALVAGAPRVQLPYGLFSVVQFRPEGAARWQGGGVQWEYLDPFTVQSIGPTQSPQSSTFGLPLDLDIDGGEDSGSVTTDAGFTPGLEFHVYGEFAASPVAWTPEQIQERALDALAAFEERQVENNFWTGTAGNTPSLASTNNVGTFALTDIHDALGALEQFIADSYGSLGVIHMARAYALSLLHNSSLVIKGNQLFTALGTPVVAGSGYPTGYMKGSPAMFGYRSDPFTSSEVRGDLLDKTQNNLYGIAERAYLLGFDPTGVGSVTIN